MLQLSAAMEDGLGAIVLSFLLALIPYYSLNMQYVLNRDNYHKLARHIVKSTMFIIVLLTAAEANSKVNLCMLSPQHKITPCGIHSYEHSR